MAQAVSHHTFANGLTLLCEKMEHVRSATLSVLLPAGCAYDPPGKAGLGSVLTEVLTRGAGSRDNRALSEALDNLGVDRDESVGVLHSRLAAATLARNLPAALEIYADILRRPHLPEAELEPAQALALQDLQSLEDEPRQKVMVELRRRHYPAPYGSDRRGTAAEIEALTIGDVKSQFHRLFRPNGTILSVAGNIEWEALLEQVGRLLGDWPAAPDLPLTPGTRQGGYAHLEKVSVEQTQIGIAYPSVPVTHPNYYAAHGAVSVLSGGMSSRLFTEVREKRGLCYSVYASYQQVGGKASVIAYAGSRNDRAQETLDVTLGELQRLAEGVEVDEVERVQAGLKSSIIMQEESTMARAGAIASDWYHLGRVRTADEIRGAIDGLSPATIVKHLREHPAGDFAIVTLGPKPLTLPASR